MARFSWLAAGTVSAATFLSVHAAQLHANERQLQFTTNEGTWLSLDVSADGKTLIFDLLGDLYTCSIAGGKARQITSGSAFDAQPRYSPDGRSIVFISDRSGADNVWLMDADGGNPRPLTRDVHTGFVSPVFTPEGDGIIVSRFSPMPYHGSYELWWYALDGGSGVRVTRSAETPEMPVEQWSNALGAVLSRDGRHLFYAHAKGGQYTGGAWAENQPVSWQIIRRDRQTGEEITLTAMPGSAMRPQVSPDGRFLTYATRERALTELRLRDLHTGEDRRLVRSIQHDDRDSFTARSDLLPGYAFTPDGHVLIAAWGGRIHRIDVSTGVVSEIEFQAQVSQRLGQRPEVRTPLGERSVTAKLVRGATLSPDGRTLAFSALARIYLMSYPSGTPHPLTADQELMAAAQPAWAPDGRSLVYVTWHPQTGGAIWIASFKGGVSIKQLTKGSAYYRDPAWSPDGKTIVALRQSNFSRQRAGGVDRVGSGRFGASEAQSDDDAMPQQSYGIITVDMNGNLRNVALQLQASKPHFAAQRRGIYVSSQGTLSYVGGDRAPVSPLLTIKTPSVVGLEQWSPRIVLNPNGKIAAVLFRGQLYVVQLPALGVPVQLDVTAPTLPVVRVSTFGTDDFTWSQSGRALVWTLGSTVFSRELATIDWSARQDTHPASELEIKISQPQQHPSGTVVFRGARVITMRGEQVVPEADVVVTEDRITAIMPTTNEDRSATVPVEARVIDARGKTIVPGFIDLHPHWSYSSVGLRLGLLDLSASALSNYLAYGVTTGRDPQAPIDVFEYADLVETGKVVGPRMLSTGPGVFGELNIGSLAEAKSVLSRYARFYKTTTIKSYLVGDRQQRQWIMEAARELGLMPTMEGAGDLRLQLTHVIDGFSGIEHVIPTAPLAKDVVQLLARSGTAYDPVLLETMGGPAGFNDFYQDPAVANDLKVGRFFPPQMVNSRMQRSAWTHPESRFVPVLARSIAEASHAGALVCVGSHGDFAGLGYQWTLWAQADGGLTPLQALQQATVNGARALGIEDRVGSLAPQMLADFLVLDANPLDDIRNTARIRYVVKGGVVYDGNTMDELYPRLRKLPRAWWWDEDQPSN